MPQKNFGLDTLPIFFDREIHKKFWKILKKFDFAAEYRKTLNSKKNSTQYKFLHTKVSFSSVAASNNTSDAIRSLKNKKHLLL